MKCVSSELLRACFKDKGKDMKRATYGAVAAKWLCSESDLHIGSEAEVAWNQLCFAVPHHQSEGIPLQDSKPGKCSNHLQIEYFMTTSFSFYLQKDLV